MAERCTPKENQVMEGGVGLNTNYLAKKAAGVVKEWRRRKRSREWRGKEEEE